MWIDVSQLLEVQDFFIFILHKKWEASETSSIYAYILLCFKWTHINTFYGKKSFNKNVISRSCTQCMKCNLLNCIFSSVLRLTALDRKTRNPERIRIVALMQTAWTEVIGWRYILFYREKQPAKRLSKDCRLDIWKSSVH